MVYIICGFKFFCSKFQFQFQFQKFQFQKFQFQFQFQFKKIQFQFNSNSIIFQTSNSNSNSNSGIGIGIAHQFQFRNWIDPMSGLNRLQLDLILLLVNFSCELGPILTRYDFLEARRVIWSNVEPTTTLPNFTFGKLFMWIGENNDQIWFSMG